MRTTINLPDALAEEAKRRAAATGRTFTSLVVDGLRRVLDEPPDARLTRTPLPAYGDADAAPLVDLLDRDALGDALDADGIR